MIAFEVKSVSHYFGGLRVLNNVSFSVEAGEKLAIIGPNGAGKTTLLNVLSGLLPCQAGRIYILGQDITSMPVYRRASLGMARSFQLNSLFPNLSLLTNFLIAIRGNKTLRFQTFRSFTAYDHLSTRIQDLLEVMALWDKKESVVEALSYGEQRKLELILSIASEPKVLLLDEPTAGLTSAESVDILTVIHKLGAETAVVVVAHDMDLVFGLADRIIVLHYGEVIASGTPEEIQADSRVKEIYMGVEESARNSGAS